ncbi:2-C-methyl-D-erythritol 4-phosphate cytidylyltransferase [Bacillota bacterium LX-D]|nr:2-C-methyl-D-erythritol 4-phosphate cytidylyltransferase [Bacillota bacterium LX-D]
MSEVAAVIVAAGRGNRMRSEIPKQYLNLVNRPVLAHTLQIFQSCPLINEVILVANKDEKDKTQQEIIKAYAFDKVTQVVAGGRERQDSVYNGLLALSAETNLVVVHDGVRPLLTVDLLERSIYEGQKYGAVIPGVPVKDTIKIANTEGFVQKTPPRDALWAVQTPQVFKKDLLLAAMEKAKKSNFCCTDEAGIVEWYGEKVKIFPGELENIKITTPEDLTFATMILEKR